MLENEKLSKIRNQVIKKTHIAFDNQNRDKLVLLLIVASMTNDEIIRLKKSLDN